MRLAKNRIFVLKQLLGSMDILVRILQIIGSLGLLLFGMKLMSEALQRAAGSRLRQSMGRAGETIGSQIGAAAAVTATVQSSSATSVTIAGFTHAGLIDLRRAIGLMMGANIGTVATVWVIALFGFALRVSVISIPLVGLGFAFVLLRKSRYRDLGETVIGFALMLLGLSVLQASTNAVAAHTGFFDELATYAGLGYPSIVVFLLIGVLLTAVLQSSAVTIAMTMILCQGGWLPLETGAAMVLGANIGTTATAVLATTTLNTSARRAALAHTAINLFGALWCAPLLPWIVPGIILCFGLFGGLGAGCTPLMLAFFDTVFNLLNVFIAANFIPQLMKLLARILPHEASDDQRRLLALDSGMISTPELALMQAHHEIATHAKRMLKMFNMVRELTCTRQLEEFRRGYAHVEKYERITDRVEREIVVFLSHIVSQDNSERATVRLQRMFRTVSDIELIGDENLELARTIRAKRERDLWFDRTLREDAERLYDMTEEAIYRMTLCLEHPEPEEVGQARKLGEVVRSWAEGRRTELLARLGEEGANPTAVFFFLELTERCAKLVGTATRMAVEQAEEAM